MLVHRQKDLWVGPLQHFLCVCAPKELDTEHVRFCKVCHSPALFHWLPKRWRCRGMEPWELSDTALLRSRNLKRFAEGWKPSKPSCSQDTGIASVGSKGSQSWLPGGWTRSSPAMGEVREGQEHRESSTHKALVPLDYRDPQPPPGTQHLMSSALISSCQAAAETRESHPGRQAGRDPWRGSRSLEQNPEHPESCTKCQVAARGIRMYGSQKIT